MAVRKVGKYFQIDYYDPNGKRIRRNFKKKKDAVAELSKRESLKAEGRYLDVKKEYDTTHETIGEPHCGIIYRMFHIMILLRL